MKKYPSNPLLPNDIYVPDVEAHVWEDGRIYLYGTYEKKDEQLGSVFHVYSSDDMVNWTDHGVAFSSSEVHWIDTKSLWAPDCAYRNGKYYLYYSIPTGECGVAVSDKPYGPFQDVGQVVGVQGIDPAVLIDDDGQAYLYWGQVDNVSVAKLKENMTEIEIDSIKHPLTVKEHEYHEGSSIRKINGKYYYLYTDTHRHGRKPTAQGYSISDNPTEGFVYKNIIIDNFGCDPLTWNDHGSIECFKGQWYIFYHRSTHATDHFRQLCAEPITIDENGDIQEVKMTSSGIGKSISAKEVIPSCYTCGLTGNARIAKDENSLHTLAVCEIVPNDTLTYRYIAFNGETNVRLRIKANGIGTIQKTRINAAVWSQNDPPRVELYLDDEYYETIRFSNATNVYSTIEQAVPPVHKTHTLTLKFFGNFVDACLDELTFY